MSVTKVIGLVIYAVMGFFAITQPENPVGVWSLRILVVLAVVHTIEIFVFFKACQRAGGSMAGHMLNVFLFGVVHIQGLKKTGDSV